MLNSLHGRLFNAWTIAAGTLCLAAIAPFLTPYGNELLTNILIYAIFAMSLDLLLGYTGLPSLGHAAYFGVSAYVTAILSVKFGVPFPLAAPAGLIATVLVAALFNILSLRTSQAYYLMITLALSQVLWSLVVSWAEITGGDNGLSIPARPSFGTWLPWWDLSSTRGYLYLTLVFFFLTTLAMYVFVNSPLGYVIKGIRENEPRMKVLGYNTWRYKYAVSIVSAFFAGVAGELYLYLQNFVSPSTLSVSLSAQVLMIVLIGAAGTLFGSFIGAVIFVLLQFVLSSFTERWLLVVGLIYIFIAMRAPNGALQYALELFSRQSRALK